MAAALSPHPRPLAAPQTHTHSPTSDPAAAATRDELRPRRARGAPSLQIRRRRQIRRRIHSPLNPVLCPRDPTEPLEPFQIERERELAPSLPDRRRQLPPAELAAVYGRPHAPLPPARAPLPPRPPPPARPALPGGAEEYVRDSIEASLGLPVPDCSLRAKLAASEDLRHRLQDRVFALEEDLHAAARRIDLLRNESGEGIRRCVEEKEAMAAARDQLAAHAARRGDMVSRSGTSSLVCDLGRRRASDKCMKEKRKTINGDDLIWSMGTLGFEDYVEPLELYLKLYRERKKEDIYCFCCLYIHIRCVPRPDVQLQPHPSYRPEVSLLGPSEVEEEMEFLHECVATAAVADVAAALAGTAGLQARVLSLCRRL